MVLIGGLAVIATVRAATVDPYIAPGTIGTFSLSASLNTTAPGSTAFLTRQEYELLPNRTKQVRHGWNLRELATGTPIAVTANVNGSFETVDSFIKKFGISGLMVVKDGAIQLEKYQYGNQPGSFDVIQSCTKSFVSTALGIAIAEGKISLNDTASKWVPEFTDTPYGDVQLEDIANMVSGVSVPDNAINYFQVSADTAPDAVFNLFKTYTKAAAPNVVYNYLDQNYYVIAVALSRAIGEPIQNYITKNIWGPAGMQYDGIMRTTAAGQVDGHGGLGIALGDMARFALFVLDNIHGRGGPKVPHGWFHDIAKASSSKGIRAPGAIEVVPNFGYQTGWWTLPRGGDRYQLGDDFAFSALGTYDQAIYVIPGLNATIVYQSSFPTHYPNLFYYGQQFATAIALELKDRGIIQRLFRSYHQMAKGNAIQSIIRRWANQGLTKIAVYMETYI